MFERIRQRWGIATLPSDSGQSLSTSRGLQPSGSLTVGDQDSKSRLANWSPCTLVSVMA